MLCAVRHRSGLSGGTRASAAHSGLALAQPATSAALPRTKVLPARIAHAHVAGAVGRAWCAAGGDALHPRKEAASTASAFCLFGQVQDDNTGAQGRARLGALPSGAGPRKTLGPALWKGVGSHSPTAFRRQA